MICRNTAAIRVNRNQTSAFDTKFQIYFFFVFQLLFFVLILTRKMICHRFRSGNGKVTNKLFIRLRMWQPITT